MGGQWVAQRLDPQSHPARPGQARLSVVIAITYKPSLLCAAHDLVCLKYFLFPEVFFPLVHLHQLFLAGPPEGAGPENGPRTLESTYCSQNTGTNT